MTYYDLGNLGELNNNHTQDADKILRFTEGCFNTWRETPSIRASYPTFETYRVYRVEQEMLKDPADRWNP
ncbi:MAG: hypothetical protein FJ115_10330 [Deltaproteobacteria bacterium]|nr:hypothetical protein [Deltaproteobacteria bacterium]